MTDTAPVDVEATIGMGGDQLVPAVAGADVERQHGDHLRAAWRENDDL